MELSHTQRPAAPPMHFAWLSVAAAIATISIKLGAYFITNSVGLLSDALESFINLVTALLTLWVLAVAARPPDQEHAYGHTKAEYLSSGVEGALIVIAAFTIVYTAVPRLIDPEPIARIGWGLALSLLAAIINLVVAQVLLRASKTYSSIALEAESRHLMTDVWSSLGVVIGLGLTVVTGYSRFDPIIALLVAVNIIWSGFQLLRRSALGLLDTALPPAELAKIEAVLAGYTAVGVSYHALRTREAGARRFISVHILVPGNWSVLVGHHLLEEIEFNIRAIIPAATVFTHLEPLEDPLSFEDTALDREEGGT